MKYNEIKLALIYIFIACLVIISCKKKLNNKKVDIDKIKFEFYRANLNNRFIKHNELTSYYFANISIDSINVKDPNSKCFIAKFYLNDTLNYRYYNNYVSMICLNKKQEVEREYLGSAYITNNDEHRLADETKLINIIKEKKVSDFLENYIANK